MTVVLILLLSGCASPGIRGPASEQILEYGTPVDTLTCPQPGVAARPDTQMVGAEGAQLRSGNVELIIPAGAMLDRRQLVLRRDSGNAARALVEEVGNRRVQFQNNLSARLVFDVSECDQEQIASAEGWWVWRANPEEGRSQKLSTLFDPRRAITAIDSASWFIIAN